MFVTCPANLIFLDMIIRIIILMRGVRLSPLGTPATRGPIVPAPSNEWVWSSWWNKNWQGKPGPVPIISPEITYDLTRDRTRDYTTLQPRRQYSS
jgi:hypothetical protein